MSVTISLNTIDEAKVDKSLITDALEQFIDASSWDSEIKQLFFALLTQKPNLRGKLNDFFESKKEEEDAIPIMIFLEEQQEFIVIFADSHMVPPEPGEEGSILAYVRAYGYGENILCSDCYGQLSCSSCAVEVLGGKAENPTPREEEYDMLDIDEQRPPTKYSRLSCQTVVGEEPLILGIRKLVH